MPATPTAARAPSLLDRALRLVGDVRPGEGSKATILGTSLFLLLASYYLLKVVRESLILSSYDAEVKVYVAAGQAVLLIPAVMGFGWLSQRVGRFRLVVSSTLFFAANLVIFAVLYAIEVPIELPFYVWVGIFNVFVISQLWAFATDVYSEKDGKRLFAVIGLGASLGAIAGAYAAEPVGDAIGTFGIFGLALALLLSTLLGAWWVHSHPTNESGDAPEAGEKPAAKGGKNALAMVLSDRYFVLIAVLLIVLNCENTLGEFLLDRVMQEDLTERLGASVSADTLENEVRAFKSIYFGAFNTIGFLIQLFVTGRVMSRFGAGVAIVILPVVALVGQLGAFASGLALMALASAKVAENSVDYSLNGTAKNALFLVVPREAKYKVKVFLDTVIVRFGDVIAGVLVIGAMAAEVSTAGFLAISTVVTVIWLAVAWILRREHGRRANEVAPPERTGTTHGADGSASPSAPAGLGRAGLARAGQ